MAGRKQTPDIMGELLSGQPESKARKKVSQKAGKTAKKPASKKARPAKKKASKAKGYPMGAYAGEKVKATFYLTPAALEALEDSWMKLRKLAKGSRGKVSKSVLVELALVEQSMDLQEEPGQDERMLWAILKMLWGCGEDRE